MADTHLGYQHYCNEGDSHLDSRRYYNEDGNLPDYHHYCNEDDSHHLAENYHNFRGCNRRLGYHRCYNEDDSHHLAGVVDNCAVDDRCFAYDHLADLNQNLQGGNHYHYYNYGQCVLSYKCADCEYVDAVCDFQFHDNCWNNFLMFVSSPHGCPHSVLLTDSEICFLILNPFSKIFVSLAAWLLFSN